MKCCHSIKKTNKQGEMISLVYFEGNVSNFSCCKLDYLSAVVFGFVTIVIHLTFYVRKSREWG